MNPYDVAEEFLRWASIRTFVLSRGEVSAIRVQLDVPPRGVAWIGAPVGFVLAKILRRKPNEIAEELARAMGEYVPGFWGQEVVCDGGFVNIRYA